MGDVAQSRGLLEAVNLLLTRLAADHAQKEVAKPQSLLAALADDHTEHDVCGGLRDGAAVADKGPVGDGIAIELELELNFVAAARVHAVEHEVGVRQVVLELRADVVLGKDLVVERISRHSPCAP